MKRKSKNLRCPTWSHLDLPAVTCALLFFAALRPDPAFGQNSARLGSSDPFVDIQALEPTIRVELRYATANNFMHRPVYPSIARCYLRLPVAEQLRAVQRELRSQGLGLKLFDCYRPRPVQRLLWAVVPDERYVANPAKGSRHSSGAAVDLTLVDGRGSELPMPTPYDDFTERAHRSYQRLPAAALANRERLAAAMVRHGFVPLPTEWWHFDSADSDRHAPADIDFAELAAAIPPIGGAAQPSEAELRCAGRSAGSCGRAGGGRP